MIAEFLLRLLVALPLVLGLAVGAILLMQRGWLPVPPRLRAGQVGRAGRLGPLPGAMPAEDARIELVASRMLQPGVRVALLRHGGREWLVGVSAQGVTFLAAGQAPLAAAMHGETVLRPAPSEAAA